MDEFDSFDPALFSVWAHKPVYGQMDDQPLADQVAHLLLEVKSAEKVVEPAEELRLLLNEMTVEMRDQFSTFRQMRTSAEAALQSDDEAAQKVARADVKAATDGMSLIVRTLEKVDSLQRQLARDREIEAERVADEGGYADAVREVERLIEERAQSLFRAWCLDAGLDPDKPSGPRGDPPQPPDTG